MKPRRSSGKVCQKPLVRAIHTAVKGRARYHVTGLCHTPALKQHLEAHLLQATSIQQVKANLSTGNILVRFNSNQNAGTIATLIDQIVREYRSHPKPVSLNSDKTPKPSRGWQAQPSLPPSFQTQGAQSWHLLPANTIVAELHSSASAGLSNRAAQVLLARYGCNGLPEMAPRSGLRMLLGQFNSLPVALLGAAAGLAIFTGGVIDALVILGVVGINAAIGYVTESRSERIIHSLKHLVKPAALVIRDGSLIEINAQLVVLGDILVLRPGSYVAADARLLEAKRLSVDESALTGESIPVAKTTEPLAGADIPLGDRVNMVYMGTLVTGGQGLAVVVATGQFTEMGRIQTLVGETTLPETPMQRQLDQAGSQLALLSGGICAGVFALGLWRGQDLLQMLKSSIALAVAAVPEGLPAVATTTLALGIQRMRQHNVLIRRLDAVETLGSVQSLCLDKTGTLTANKMSVVELHTDTQHILVNEHQFTTENIAIAPSQHEPLLKLMEILVLCNESELNGTGNRYALHGSATENALIEVAIAAGVDVRQVRSQHPLLKMTHRSEDRNYMTTLHQTPQKNLLAVKGNPSEVLMLCNWRIQENRVVPLTEADRVAIESANDRMAGNALRVLGAAYCYVEADGNHAMALAEPTANHAEVTSEALVWLGLVGMTDPIRKGVKDLIRVFHRAGIDTVMITGDQSSTAYAIGKQLDLSDGQHLQIMDSTHLTEIDPEIIKALCQQVHIFARISPAHKLQVVQALQQAGKVVAMTGDGINDAPALKAANVGVAMGNTGTDVAREVADVVLQDDELATMAIAVSQGRTIYSNIRKSVHYLLSTNLSEILVMLMATACGWGQPLNAMQLLWLNLVTDVFPALGLAMEPPEPDVLNHPPRDPSEQIIQSADFRRLGLEAALLSTSALGAYGYAIARYGIGPQASTIAFMSLSSAQLLHALSCRSQTHRLWGTPQLATNRYLEIALIGSLTLQVLAVLIPGLRQLLNSTPIPRLDSLVIGSSALLPLLINEGTKTIRPSDRVSQTPAGDHP